MVVTKSLSIATADDNNLFKQSHDKQQNSKWNVLPFVHWNRINAIEAAVVDALEAFGLK